MKNQAKQSRPLRIAAIAAVLFCVSAACVAGPLEEANKKLVLGFQSEVLNGKDAAAAAKYVAENYVQHNPRIPDGLAALQGFVRSLKQNAPASSATVKRIVAEGDLVVLHSHRKNGLDDRGSALVDIFRIQDGKLVEHWDVMQPIPDGSANANGMF